MQKVELGKMVHGGPAAGYSRPIKDTGSEETLRMGEVVIRPRESTHFDVTPPKESPLPEGGR
jgi:hypothetical protein